MSEETNNPGRLAAQEYKGDPVNTDSPTSSHHEFEKGVRAEVLLSQQDIIDALQDFIDLVSPLLPTQDQKDAMDVANMPAIINAFATLQDLTDQASAVQTAYTWRTALDAPADGEMKMDNVNPVLSVLLRIANINFNGLNISNILLTLGENDNLIVGDNNEATKVYNFDVTGSPTQVGGSGSGGYVEVPVALFSQGVGGLIGDAELCNLLVRFDGNNTRFLQKTANLSDLSSIATALVNLGLINETASEAKYLQVLNNLSDLNNDGTARGNLDVDSSGEVDTKISNAVSTESALTLKKASNLSDVASVSTSRISLGLGNSATLDTGTGAGTVALGNHTHATLPTTDQKAAMDNATAPTAGNPFVTLSELPGTVVLNSTDGAHIPSVGNLGIRFDFFDHQCRFWGVVTIQVVTAGPPPKPTFWEVYTFNRNGERYVFLDKNTLEWWLYSFDPTLDWITNDFEQYDTDETWTAINGRDGSAGSRFDQCTTIILEQVINT